MYIPNNFEYEIGSWFSKLKSIESTARGSCQTYKEAEQSFINQEKLLNNLIQNNHTTNIRKQIQIKQKAEQRLLRLGREILLEKQKYIAVVRQVKKQIHLKSQKIGVFAKDMALKNFIHQVNNLKNREYDLNQVIDNFNQTWENNVKKSSLDSQPVESQDDSLAPLEPPTQQATLDNKYKALPLKLDIPQKQFFLFLEKEFYKSIHHDLLSKQHVIDGNFQNKIKYDLFGNECVILSKLLDGLVISNHEKAILGVLPKKDSEGYFVDKFLESFLRYKKDTLILHPIPMTFFISKIIKPLFHTLSSKNKHARIYSIVVKVQRMQVKGVGLLPSPSPLPLPPPSPKPSTNLQSQSMVLPKNSKAISVSSSQILESKSENLDSGCIHFRDWLTTRQNDPLEGALDSKNFWIIALSKIFNTRNAGVSSSLLDQSLISSTSLKTFDAHNLSFFERIKQKGHKLISLHNKQDKQLDPTSTPNQLDSTLSIELQTP